MSTVLLLSGDIAKAFKRGCRNQHEHQPQASPDQMGTQPGPQVNKLILQRVEYLKHVGIGRPGLGLVIDTCRVELVLESKAIAIWPGQ